MTGEQILAGAGLKIVTRAEFDAATDVPAFIRRLADAVNAQWNHRFIIYDPKGGDDGWLLIGDDRAELVSETVEYRCREQAEQSAQPSLF
jgi:hypothetical protein